MAKVMPLHEGQVGRNTLFTRLVRPHLKAMYRMAYRLTQSRVEAEDLVQETLASLIDHTGEMTRVNKLAPWLNKVLYRNFVDFYRRRLRSPIDGSKAWRGDMALMDELPGEGEHQITLARQRDLLKALEQLSSEQRDVVLLHDAEEYTALEVSSILGISLGTVKSRLHRGRRRLQALLEETPPPA